MRLIALLFAATVNAFLLNCDGGTAGDGGCEANGLHTYCVSVTRLVFFSSSSVLKYIRSAMNLLRLRCTFTSATSPFCRRILRATVTASRRVPTRPGEFSVLHKLDSVNRADNLALFFEFSRYSLRQEGF